MSVPLETNMIDCSDVKEIFFKDFCIYYIEMPRFKKSEDKQNTEFKIKFYNQLKKDGFVSATDNGCVYCVNQKNTKPKITHEGLDLVANRLHHFNSKPQIPLKLMLKMLPWKQKKCYNQTENLYRNLYFVCDVNMEKKRITCLSYDVDYDDLEKKCLLKQKVLTYNEYDDGYLKHKEKQYLRCNYDSKLDQFVPNKNGEWICKQDRYKNKNTTMTAYDIGADVGNTTKLQHRHFLITLLKKFYNQYFVKEISFKSIKFDVIPTTKVDHRLSLFKENGVFFYDTTNTYHGDDFGLVHVPKLEDANNKPLIVVTESKEHYEKNKLEDPKTEIYRARQGMPTQTVHKESISKKKKSDNQVTLKSCINQLMIKEMSIRKKIPDAFNFNGRLIFNQETNYICNDTGKTTQASFIQVESENNKITKNKTHILSGKPDHTTKQEITTFIKDGKEINVVNTEIQLSPNCSDYVLRKELFNKHKDYNLTDYLDDIVCSIEKNKHILKKESHKEMSVVITNLLKEYKECGEFLNFKMLKNKISDFNLISHGWFKVIAKDINLVLNISRTKSDDILLAYSHHKLSCCKNYLAIGSVQPPDEPVNKFLRLVRLSGDTNLKELYAKHLSFQNSSLVGTSKIHPLLAIARAKQDYKNTIKPTSSIASG